MVTDGYGRAGDSELRIKALDSLRGLAAVSVIASHVVLMLPGGDQNGWRRDALNAPFAWLYFTPLRVLVSPAVVMMFFVMSGVVITLSLQKNRSFTAFAVNRVLRIWPVFAVAICTSALLAYFIGWRPLVGHGVSVQFDKTWSQPVNVPELLKHLVLSGGATRLDGPMWSLVHEIRLSLILPLLTAFIMKNWRLSLAFSLTLVLAGAWILGHFPLWTLATSLIMSIIMAFPFICGVVIAVNLNPIRNFLTDRSKAGILTFWIFALVLFTISPSYVAVVASLRKGCFMLSSTLGAAMIVALLSTDGLVARLLNNPIFRWLGKISYGLYLWHMIMITAVVRMSYGHLPIFLALGLSLPLTILLATASQRWIEAPVAQFAKRISTAVSTLKNARGSFSANALVRQV